MDVPAQEERELALLSPFLAPRELDDAQPHWWEQFSWVQWFKYYSLLETPSQTIPEMMFYQIFGQPLAQLTHKIQYATEAAFTIFILYFLIQTLSQLKVCQEIQTLQNHELSWILQNSHMQALFVTLFQGLHNDVSVNFDVKLPLEFQNVVAVNILKIHLKQWAFMLQSHFKRL